MDIAKLCIIKDQTIKQALQCLDENAMKILFVINKDKKLLGTITDGDIRRWILKNGSLNETVDKIMNTKPYTLNERDKTKARKIMKKKNIQAIPVIDNERELVSVIFWKDVFDNTFKVNRIIKTPVVVMAGGKGTRLKPYTNIIPKPLIPIGDIPIVERIINRFNDYGCKDFYMSVNYKKNIIKAYFNDLETDYNIHFIDEEKPLGTAGSLYMLKEKIKDTFFLSNSDILVNADYSDILAFHKKQKNKITMITSLKHYTIPYGVINIDQTGYVEDITEKPQIDYLVNTGVYILEPEVINDIPENTFYHITHLVNEYLEKGEKVGTYPVSEKSWLDMGQVEEMKRMINTLERE
ncbi:nucleotidyltransferase family protein [Wukongibacter baidiensis]|uniref:nucleotidyltransferase family protein n=1 Tax=Wukongibacter baidiensis TaxID=1723361 RepID=UPI003D7FC70C